MKVNSEYSLLAGSGVSAETGSAPVGDIFDKPGNASDYED